MSRGKTKYYIKLPTTSEYYWAELNGAESLEDAKLLADQGENLGEIAIIDKGPGMKVLYKKDAQGKWQKVF